MRAQKRVIPGIAHHHTSLRFVSCSFSVLLVLFLHSNVLSKLSCMSQEKELSATASSPSKGSQLNKAQLAMAEAMALKMQEKDRKRDEDRKRKREEEERREKNIKARISTERQKIDDEENYVVNANRELYAMFNDLQGISHDFAIAFETPELVVVGMQSDGKSSFIEALLGFQFNIVESNIGTRRPLIIQMINNPDREQPLCKFRKEIIDVGTEDPWESQDTHVEDLCEEIIRRTNTVAGRGDQVSSVPIILRVEFCHCANLNIYDTPGFRLGGDEKLKNEIMEMVLKMVEPKNRIIVCLDQSTTEWVNTVSRPLIRKVDPDFSRTILINTKFDNRVKELRTKSAVDKYLAGEGLPPNKKPFFISLPLRRGSNAKKFKEDIKECYMDDFRTLMEIGFDEKKYASQIGFCRAKSFMENLLNEKYHQSLAPTLRLLEAVCKKTEQEINAVKKELQENNIENLKAKVQKFVQAYIVQVERLLEGSIIGDPDKFGQTLQEEKDTCGVQNWPNFDFNFEVQNLNFKLYGGSQYERLVNEFEFVAHSREFPPPSMNEVASALGSAKSHNVPVFETAATNIVQIKSRRLLQPLIDIVLQRCSFIMGRLFDIGTEILKHEEDDKGFAIVALYDLFMDELKKKYFEFIETVEAECRTKLKDDFDTVTKIVDWDLFTGLGEVKEYDVSQVTKEQTIERVNAIMQPNKSFGFEGDRTRRIDSNSFQQVCRLAGKLFAGIRYFFAKYIRNKLNAFFLEPMFQRLGAELIDHFFKLPDNKYEEMFQLGITELKAMQHRLESQLEKCRGNRDRFREAFTKMTKSSQDMFEKRTSQLLVEKV